MSQTVVSRALELAEQDYKDNAVIQSILKNFKQKLRHFQLTNPPKYYDPLSPYLYGLAGERGYAFILGDDTITSMIKDPVKRLIDLAVIQGLMEQLILALNALGEDIDF
jgi:hypothetical protein